LIDRDQPAVIERSDRLFNYGRKAGRWQSRLTQWNLNLRTNVSILSTCGPVRGQSMADRQAGHQRKRRPRVVGHLDRSDLRFRDRT
jgi:hypothetical protein